jgi:signal peptidase I
MDKQIELLIEELRYEGILTTEIANRIIKRLTEAIETPADRLVKSYKLGEGDTVYYFDPELGTINNATFCLYQEDDLALIIPEGAKGPMSVDRDCIYPLAYNHTIPTDNRGLNPPMEYKEGDKVHVYNVAGGLYNAVFGRVKDEETAWVVMEKTGLLKEWPRSNIYPGRFKGNSQSLITKRPNPL